MRERGGREQEQEGKGKIKRFQRDRRKMEN